VVSGARQAQNGLEKFPASKVETACLKLHYNLRMKYISRFTTLVVLFPLLLTACASGPEAEQPVPPVPTSIQLTFTGDTVPVLGSGGTGQIELHREGAGEPVLLEFQNGVAEIHNLPPGKYSVEKIGVLTCRAMTFDIDPSARARALGSIEARIITTDYYVALVSRHPATQAELAGFAAQVQTPLDGIDARPISVAEKAPCFLGTGGQGTTWQERPLGEKILLGIGFAGFCAIALASGGFCAF
jgi:hypothetical protein